MTGESRGYLDRLRENIEVLDEAIAIARESSKAKENNNRMSLQWSKVLRELVELRNVTLINIKAHMIGRDQTGVVNEPLDHYDGNQEVEFEREFQKFMKLSIKCQDCGRESEEVSTRRIRHEALIPDEYVKLCNKCYQNRTNSEFVDEDEEASYEG